MISIPYTYFLRHIPTDLKYYGVQYGKKANPDNLWVKYFSSSRKVKHLISEFGKDSFVFEIRKVFTNGDDAFKWEQKVINRMRLKERHDWLNQTANTGPFYHRGDMTEEHKQKISNALSGKVKTKNHCNKISISKMGSIPWNWGISCSVETRKKISEMRKGRPTRTGAILSQETKDKIRNSLKGRKGRKRSRESILKGILSNTGYRHSEASKEKMRQAKLGKKLAEEHKRKIGESTRKRFDKTP